MFLQSRESVRLWTKLAGVHGNPEPCAQKQMTLHSTWPFAPLWKEPEDVGKIYKNIFFLHMQIALLFQLRKLGPAPTLLRQMQTYCTQAIKISLSSRPWGDRPQSKGVADSTLILSSEPCQLILSQNTRTKLTTKIYILIHIIV